MPLFDSAMNPLARQRYTILVVDDDPSVLDCYRKLLSRSGYKAVIESDPRRVLIGGRALDDVDLLLVDYKMPEMDGLSLLAELRRREFRARCILISAFLNEGVRQQARHLGVDHILEKPVDVGSLRGALAELLPEEGDRSAGWVS
ncbi:MAG TPA: response regulator [Candidatus Polarisedimenticolaceae bacterium]|nr:response regulator [Candidatus Polarisedimenticolaceae bacterium]